MGKKPASAMANRRAEFRKTRVVPGFFVVVHGFALEN